jgi:uncharacterized membrane protein
MKRKANEKHQRSIIKSITYRILSITADAFVAYFFTKSAIATLGIVTLVNGYSTILYYFHERAWAYIPLGKTKDE